MRSFYEGSVRYYRSSCDFGDTSEVDVWDYIEYTPGLFSDENSARVRQASTNDDGKLALFSRRYDPSKIGNDPVKSLIFEAIAAFYHNTENPASEYGLYKAVWARVVEVYPTLSYWRVYRLVVALQAEGN